MNKTFNFIFILLVLADLMTFQFLDLPEIRFYTKPAIAGSLIVLLLVTPIGKQRLKNFILLALLFSLIGDILLLFTGKAEHYFLLGLLSFLLAHASYILAYVHRGYFDAAKVAWKGLLIIFYAILVYLYIADSLGDRQPYVIAYIFILILLGLVALLRKSYVSRKSYLWVLAGAMLFILSDSLLAIETFKTVIPYGGVAIMITYAMAQWFLVHGGIEQDRTEPVQNGQ